MTLASDNPVDNDEVRKVVLHVNFDQEPALNFALNNAENIYSYYADTGTNVEIRIIAHGPGLHMLREDTSPVKDRIVAMDADLDGLSFYACTNTYELMAKAERQAPVIMSQATMVPSGIVEILELQRTSWEYLKP
jgi:intracellular sulfur oxidation DsrE/DsrF family protein